MCVTKKYFVIKIRHLVYCVTCIECLPRKCLGPLRPIIIKIPKALRNSFLQSMALRFRHFMIIRGPLLTKFYKGAKRAVSKRASKSISRRGEKGLCNYRKKQFPPRKGKKFCQKVDERGTAGTPPPAIKWENCIPQSSTMFSCWSPM